MSLVFDYIVVGAGTAGCLLANRLSADPSKRVLLLEAGGSDNYHWIKIPVGYLYCIGNPRTDWLFKTDSETGLNGRSLRYPRGRVLGGCSSINGMIYMRGQSQDYEAWVEAGNAGWGWNEVLPYFLKHEDHYRAALGDPLHRAGGEWRVDKQRLHWEILDAWREAAAEVGIPKTEDFNLGDNFGCGYFEVNQRDGVRWNASRAFLDSVRSRPNLEIWTQAVVDRLVLEADPTDAKPLVVRGVSVSVKGAPSQELLIRAGGEVLLAAGAIGSPQILELSGVGRSDVLAAAGVPVLLEESGVGENLQDHLQLRTIYKVQGAKTLNTLANSWFGKLQIALEYAVRRSGPMSMAPSQLGAFAKSGPEQTRANVQYHVQPLSLNQFGEPLHGFPAMTASVCNLRPSSRGSTHIHSASSTTAPSIRPNYLSTEADLKVAADSIRLTRSIMAAPALARYRPEEFLPGAKVQSEEELVDAARNIGTTIFHPVGTAKMGSESDPMSVVDSQGRAHRIRGLRIADASVMPTITSGNTNSPTLMIAEKIAEAIVASSLR